MKKVQTDRMVAFIASSVEDVVSYGNASSAPEESAHEEDPAFFASKDWQEHTQWMRTGYQEGRRIFDRERKGSGIAVGAPVVESFESVYGPAGGSVDMGRFMAGEPDCMVSHELVEAEGSGDIITILAAGNCHYGVKPVELARYGVALAVAVDLLEANGYRVELLMNYSIEGCSETNNRTLEHVVPVKRSDEPLDVDRVIKTVVYPGFFRRTVFRAREASWHALGYANTPRSISYGASMLKASGDLQKLIQPNAVLESVIRSPDSSVRNHLRYIFETLDLDLDLSA